MVAATLKGAPMAHPPRGTPRAFRSPGAPAAPSKQQQQSSTPPPAAQPPPLLINVNTDPTTWLHLPSQVVGKLRGLRRQHDDARGVLRVISDERSALLERKRVDESRLAALTGPHSQFGNLIDQDHPELLAVKHRIEAARSEIARLEPLQAARAHPIK